MIQMAMVAFTKGDELVAITGPHGKRKAHSDNPVEIGLAVIEVLQGKMLAPIPAHCAIHFVEKEASDAGQSAA